MKKKKKQSVELKQGTKSLRNLVKDEDGFVSKKTILKVGLATGFALGAIGVASDSFASYLDSTDHLDAAHLDSSVPRATDPTTGCVTNVDHKDIPASSSWPHSAYTTY